MPLQLLTVLGRVEAAGTLIHFDLLPVFVLEMVQVGARVLGIISTVRAGIVALDLALGQVSVVFTFFVYRIPAHWTSHHEGVTAAMHHRW
jgi:hypothetical protein